MKWNDIDDSWFWSPPAGSKNKRLHAVPLSSLTQRVLSPRKAEGFVFPGSRAGPLDFEPHHRTLLS
jgi:hypothetical protein